MPDKKLTELPESLLADLKDDALLYVVIDGVSYRSKLSTIKNFAADTYSTSEVAINKRWIDGKTIYRKVVNF